MFVLMGNRGSENITLSAEEGTAVNDNEAAYTIDADMQKMRISHFNHGQTFQLLQRYGKYKRWMSSVMDVPPILPLLSSPRYFKDTL
jgi:hypothetical protein